MNLKKKKKKAVFFEAKIKVFLLRRLQDREISAKFPAPSTMGGSDSSKDLYYDKEPCHAPLLRLCDAY